jgi:osmotically-inducible protein OsmY
MERSDIQLKQDVVAELEWDPRLDASKVRVEVRNGVVTFFGRVSTYAEKWAAEEAARRVVGVRALAEELTVTIPGEDRPSDTAIAEAAARALEWDVVVPATISVMVQDGHLTLRGHVKLNYQREAAASAVRQLSGVVSVSNDVDIDASATEEDTQRNIESALKRQATIDAKSIHVSASGGTVTLSGEASSWHAISDAIAAAWSASGTTQVIDNISISKQ